MACIEKVLYTNCAGYNKGELENEYIFYVNGRKQKDIIKSINIKHLSNSQAVHFKKIIKIHNYNVAKK